ncbi:hypothetical protein ACIQ7N_17915 [Lysinibacillus sp. NPDC095746]|uniref:hypothetical protein n=1 Tax=Lysinibacillus sp. NPDC095746 TaxID=3364134 RepID=UPI003800932D
MKIYKSWMCTFILLLSGCNTFSAKTAVSSSKVTSEAVKSEPDVLNITQKEKGPEPGTTDPIEIDEEITSSIGESKSLMMEMFHLKYL